MADARGQAPAGQPEPGEPAPGTYGNGVTGPDEQAGREVPSGPAKAGGSWSAAAKRTLAEFADDQLTDRAAALTYYAVLSIFPGLLVVASLLGLLGQRTKSLVTNLTQAAPSNVQQVIKPVTSNLQDGRSAAGLLSARATMLSRSPRSCRRRPATDVARSAAMRSMSASDARGAVGARSDRRAGSVSRVARMICAALPCSPPVGCRPPSSW